MLLTKRQRLAAAIIGTPGSTKNFIKKKICHTSLTIVTLMITSVIMFGFLIIDYRKIIIGFLERTNNFINDSLLYMIKVFGWTGSNDTLISFLSQPFCLSFKLVETV